MMMKAKEEDPQACEQFIVGTGGGAKKKRKTTDPGSSMVGRRMK